MARSRVQLFEMIRRDRRLEGLSIRELAERHKVHRRAVRQALADPLPLPRKVYPARSRPAIDPLSHTTLRDATSLEPFRPEDRSLDQGFGEGMLGPTRRGPRGRGRLRHLFTAAPNGVDASAVIKAVDT